MFSRKNKLINQILNRNSNHNQNKLQEPKPEEPKKEEPKTNDVTPSNEGNEQQASVPTKKVEELPQTGTGQEFAIFGAAASSILAGLGLLVPTFKKKEK